MSEFNLSKKQSNMGFEADLDSEGTPRRYDYEMVIKSKDVKEFIKERLRAFEDTLCLRNNTEEKVRDAVIKEIWKTRKLAGEELLKDE